MDEYAYVSQTVGLAEFQLHKFENDSPPPFRIIRVERGGLEDVLDEIEPDEEVGLLLDNPFDAKMVDFPPNVWVGVQVGSQEESHVVTDLLRFTAPTCERFVVLDAPVNLRGCVDQASGRLYNALEGRRTRSRRGNGPRLDLVLATRDEMNNSRMAALEWAVVEAGVSFAWVDYV